MQTTDLTVEVRDASLARVAQIAPGHLDLRAELADCAVGTWTLRLPAEHPAVPHLLRPGAGVVVTGPDGVAFSGPVDTPTVDADLADPAGIATVSGVTDDVLLWNRLAYPVPTVLAASAQDAAYDVRDGRPETVMRAFVEANLGASAPEGRRVPGLLLSDDQGRGGAPIRKSARFDVLGDLLAEIATVAGLRFRLVQAGGALRFEVLDVRDRRDTVRFDLANGTLSAHSVATTPPRVTRAVVGGPGEGALRVLVDVTDPATEAAEAARGPWGRVETFVDQRSGTGDELVQAGAKALADGAGATSASAVPSDDLTMRYAVDWDLGDAVTVVVGDVESTARVTAVALLVDASGARVGATIGDLHGSTPLQALTRRTDAVDRRVSSLERTAEAGRVTELVPVSGDEDLDTFRVTGTWSVDADVAASLRNVPATGRASLTVTALPGRVVQRYAVDAGAAGSGRPTELVRVGDVVGETVVWRAWERTGDVRVLASQAELDAYRTSTSAASGPLLVVRPQHPGQVFRVSADGGHTWERTTPEPVPYTYPALGAGFERYGDRYHAPGYVRSRSGIVALTGLFRGGTDGSVLFTLPASMRPAGKRLALVASGNGVGRVDVMENGDVVPRSRPAAGTWVSLDGILFPSSDIAPESAWAPIPTWGAGWSDYRPLDTTWPVASSFQDAYGRVWFRGLIRGPGGSITADQPALSTGRGGPPVQVHAPGLGSGAYASLDVLQDGWVRVKQGTAGTGWITLSHATYVPASVHPLSDYEALPAFLSGWVDYSTSQPPQCFLRLGDGMVMLEGLIKGGTPSQTSVSAVFPAGAAPDTAPFARRGMVGDLIFPGSANNANARFDAGSLISGTVGTPVLTQTTGSNTWRSLHGITYFIGG